MSLLDDARRLVKVPSVFEDGQDYACRFCGAVVDLYPPHSGHASDCPWLSMPKIVAVLEAAHAVALAYDRETAATGLHLLGSPLLAAVDALDKALEG